MIGARIFVHSQFNITAWKSYLTKYWDKQIVDLLQYVFPCNHASALTFPEHVENYIKTEIE